MSSALDSKSLVNKRLLRWVPLTLLVVGTIGNSLSAAVFSRPLMRGSLPAFMFRILAFADTATLWSAQLPTILVMWFRAAGVLHNEASCKVYLLTTQVCARFAVWVLVIINLERMVYVVFPHKAKFMVTKRRAMALMAVTLLVLIGLLFPRVLTTGHMTMRDSTGNVIGVFCPLVPYPKWRALASVYIPTMYFITGSALPFTIILICNILILVRMVRSRQLRQKAMAAPDDDGKGLTVTLLVNSTMFLLLTMPNVIVVIYNAGSTTSPVRYFMALTAQIAVGSQFAVNFFLYCLAGRDFRRELVKMFQCK